MTNAERKPLFWVGSSRKDMQGMPEDVKDVFGSAFLDAQYGDTPEGARPFGEGLPSAVMKLVEDHEGDTYRAAYTVAFEQAVHVLDVFQKKSKAGRSTPKHIEDRYVLDSRQLKGSTGADSEEGDNERTNQRSGR